MDERKFQEWYKKVRSIKTFLPENPDDELDYDYRMFYEKMPEQAEKMLQGDKNAHFSDIGKRPTHPTFSDESAYHTTETPGGHWSKTGNKLPNGNDQWKFEHSDYTAKNLKKTTDYMKNNDDGSLATYKGGVVLPEIQVKPKQNSMLEKYKPRNSVWNE